MKRTRQIDWQIVLTVRLDCDSVVSSSLKITNNLFMRLKRYKRGECPRRCFDMIKLLIVDDEENTREGLKNFVPWAELGIDDICLAGDGVAALDVFAQEDPDIILCDVRMPRMNGIEFAQNVKERKSGCKIIFLSGFSDKEYLKSAIKLGATDYIEKPVIMRELMAVIEKTVKIISDEQVRIKIAESMSGFRSNLAEKLISPDDDFITAPGKRDSINKKTDKLEAFIERHYGDKDLTMKRLSRHLDLSPNYMCGMFKKKTGGTINDYLTDVRIHKAGEMLRDHDIKIYEIADRTGFQTPNYFSRLFKKKTGLTPSGYREKFFS